MTWPNDVVTRTVTGAYLSGTGGPAQGRVTFTPTASVYDTSGTLIVEDTITAVLDNNGAFSLELPTTDNRLLSPQGWAYEVSVRLYGVKPKKFYVTLPVGDGSSVSIVNEMSASATAPVVNEVALIQLADESIPSAAGSFNDVVTRAVTGTYLNGLGEAAVGRVTFTPTARVVDANDAVIIENPIVATLDATGTFLVNLPTTDNKLLYPTGWAYEVSVRVNGVKPQKFYAFLPYGDGSTVDIRTSVSATTSTVTDGSAPPPAVAGPAGPRGPGTLVGEGTPSSTLGQVGDLYIDSLTGTYYGPKTSSGWPVEPLYVIGEAPTRRYVHTQGTAASTWTVTHALGGRPSVTVVDSAGTVVIGDISYNSDTEVTISFTSPFSGYAYLT